MSTIIISAQKITKVFSTSTAVIPVLKGVDLNLCEGEFVAITGKSGAGKSTLLYQLSLLDFPTSGNIVIDGQDVGLLSEKEKSQFRLHTLGYVFQDYALLPELTARENIMIPLIMQGIPKKIAVKMSRQALQDVNLLHRENNLPPELSGGEQQRVSIARAITHGPRILFADEPTANLDLASSDLIMNILKNLNKKNGLTIVMVTHEIEYAKMADRIVKLSDGMVVHN